MTPEAWRALRSRVTRSFWTVLGLVVASKPLQLAATNWLDVHVKALPPAWVGILPTGAAMVSFVLAWVGGHRNDPTNTYLVRDRVLDATAVEKPTRGPTAPPSAEGYVLPTSAPGTISADPGRYLTDRPTSVADGFTGTVQFAPDVIGSDQPPRPEDYGAGVTSTSFDGTDEPVARGPE